MKIKSMCIDAYENDAYPFDLLIEELVNDRDISRSPIFDVLVSLNNISSSEIRGESTDHHLYILNELEVGSSHDLAFIMQESLNEISFSITYNLDLFHAETIARLGEQIFLIIESVSANPEIKLKDIQMLSKTAIDELIGHTTVDVEGANSLPVIHQVFESVVAKYPSHIACSFADEKISYQKLNKEANKVAHALRTKGAKEGTIIPIICDRSLEMIICILGVLKSGGAYLPIDPRLPNNRIEAILRDSDCRLVLGSHEIQGKFMSLIDLEFLWLNDALIVESPSANPKIANCNNDLAYIIYTSGSTGKPKGVMVEHRNVISLFFNNSSLFQFSEKDKWTLFHSISFDFSVWEIFGALLFGGQLVLIPREVSLNYSSLLTLLEREKITVLSLVPNPFYELIDIAVGKNRVDFCLKYVFLGGDILHPHRLKGWRKIYPLADIVNMYGITETTIHVTYKVITDADIASGLSNIGKPLQTSKVYIMDRNQNLLPPGVIGEIYVAGQGLARGYLNSPDLTASKFNLNPYRSDETIYKSGDMGRYLGNGELEYIGRKDNQVKIRGFRIELGEIEYFIRQVDNVKDVTVHLTEDSVGEKFICAFVMSDILEDFDMEHQVSEYLKSRLPSYMLPSFIFPVDAFPLTMNGKIDFAQLRRQMESGADSKNYIPPSNRIEQTLFLIWKEVLNTDQFGIDNDFFFIGGHSLKAAKVTALIHKHFNVEIKLGVFFDDPTIRGLAKNISFIEWNNQERNDLDENEIEILI
jgi:amino acid adenylation domain-containing protein